MPTKNSVQKPKNKLKIRDPYAEHAKKRKAGPHKDKRKTKKFRQKLNKIEELAN